AMSDGEGYAGRRVHRLDHTAAAQVHVHAAGQARVEAADRPHDVDALEVLRRVLLEDRGVLHRVLVWPRRSVGVPDAAVPTPRRGPGGGRELSAPYPPLVGEDAAGRPAETPTQGPRRPP